MNNQYEKNMLIELLKKNGQQKYTNKLNNKTFYWEINTNKIELNKRGVFGYLKCIRDVTQKLETQKNLQKIARTDELSQLLNRREFFRRGNHLFKECMTYKSRVTMAMVDIDFFKKVNDTYGHSIGDLVIKAIGKVLKKSFREDDIVARTGGEEFAVLFKNVPKEEGIKRLECFRKEIESAIMVPENHEVKVTVSIGLAFYNEGTNSLDELMVNADKALYQAKRKGRNRLELFDGDENV
jgi:diguanylate cyclase (GGDEF)-like protein